MLRKIASNTISQILSKVSTSIIAIFLIWILTRYLTPGEYWNYNKIYNYLSIFTFLFDLWLYTLTIREISQNKQKVDYIIWNIMTLRIIVSIILLFLAITIAIFLPWYNSKLSLVSIFIVSLFSIVSLFNSSILALMQSYMKIEFSVLSLTLWKIVNLAVIWAIVFLIYPNPEWINRSYAFIWIMLSGLIWLLVNFFMNLKYARKIANIKFLFDMKYIKHLFLKSLPYWIALFLSVLYFKIDVVLLSVIEWAKWDISVWLYSLPMKIVEVLMVFGWFFLNSLLPSLAVLFEEKNYTKIKTLFDNAFKFLFSFWVYIVLIFSLFRDNIITIVSTKEYLASSNVFVIVIWVLLFYYISLIFNYIFISSKKEKLLLYINIFITLFNIIWNIILIPKYSYMWAWVITLISQIILCLLWFIFSRTIINVKIDVLYMLKIWIWAWILFFVTQKLLEIISINWAFGLIIYIWILSLIFIWYLFLINYKLIKTHFKKG